MENLGGSNSSQSQPIEKLNPRQESSSMKWVQKLSLSFDESLFQKKINNEKRNESEISMLEWHAHTLKE